MELKKLVGKKIQQIRKHKGITQEKLAEMIGIEVPSLSNLETGKYSPSTETLQKLSMVLGVKVWEFYYVEDISCEQMHKELIQALNENPKLVKFFYNILKSMEF